MAVKKITPTSRKGTAKEEETGSQKTEASSKKQESKDKNPKE